MTYDVAIDFDVQIPMPDGVRLAANRFRPVGDGAPQETPAIITLLPYHKDGRGGVGVLDVISRHFASRGYTVLLVDLRGTGSSEGAPWRTLDGRERQDGHHVVEWAAAQEWCTGTVGFWGGSYGGITAMATAETKPPHLRAIVPMNAPTDNYESMIVHRGARLMYWPDPHWGARMAASNLMPPLRSYDGDDWQRTWEARLETDPWIFDWHGPPPDPDHWIRQRVDASQIDVPALVICGWQDAYPDSVSDYWPLLKGPKRLVFGPWKHVIPELSYRAPIDILTLIDRWWDRWLKDEQNGVDEEPPIRLYIQGAEYWRDELAWPPQRQTTRTFFPGPDGALDSSEAESGADSYTYDARAGVCALAYDACTDPIPYPADQSPDDYLSRCYTTAPLDAPLELIGSPVVRVAFKATIPADDLNISVKLTDVLPSGESHLITFEHISGTRAGTIANGDAPEVTFVLRPTAYVVQPGHRLRLAISGSNFPYLWPSPYPYELEILRAETRLDLPVAGPQEPALPLPEIAAPIAELGGGPRSGGDRYWIHREETRPVVNFEGLRETRLQVQPAVSLSVTHHFEMTVDAGHPASASTRTDTTWTLERDSGPTQVRVETLTTLGEVVVDAAIDHHGSPYFRRCWRKSRHA